MYRNLLISSFNLFVASLYTLYSCIAYVAIQLRLYCSYKYSCNIVAMMECYLMSNASPNYAVAPIKEVTKKLY